MLKRGKDLQNNEHVLVIPNQVTIIFDFAFTKMKLITKQGIKEISIDPKKIKIKLYNGVEIDFEGDSENFSIRSGVYRYNHIQYKYLSLNHNHVKNMIGLLLENVPFKFEDYKLESDPKKVKDVKCYPTRIVITYDDDLGKVIKGSDNVGRRLSTWQYYFHLRDNKDEI
jgi:hypothetical protein